MITAKLNNTPIDLPAGFTFELVQQSQLFQFDKLAGDTVPSVSFPPTPRNLALFNHPNRFENRGTPLKEYQGLTIEVCGTGAQLGTKGFEIVAGTLVLTDQLNGSVRTGAGNLAALNTDKNITDAALPTTQTFANKESYSPSVDDYAAPLLYNRDFFKDIGSVKPYPLTINGEEQEYEETTVQHAHRRRDYAVNSSDQQGLIEYKTGYTQLADMENTYLNVVSPMLYYFKAIQMLLLANGFHCVKNDLDGSGLEKLVVYNNFTINDLSLDLSVIETQGYEQYDGSSVTLTMEITRYAHSLNTFKYTSLLPVATLKDFILSGQNLLNFATIFTQNRYQIIDRETIFTKAAIDLDAYFEGTWVMKNSSKPLIRFRMEGDPNDYYWSTYFQDLSERASDFRADVDTKAALDAITNAPIGTLCRVTNEHRVYEFNTITLADTDGAEIEAVGWKFVSIDFQFLRYNWEADNSETIEIITKACTAPYTGTAQVAQAGRMSLRKDTNAGFTLRLLFDTNGIATNANGTYTLNYRYENNVIETRWPKTLRFLSNMQKAEGMFNLPIHILASISNKPYAVWNFNTNRFRTRYGEFIIDRMVTQFANGGIVATKMDVWKT